MMLDILAVLFSPVKALFWKLVARVLARPAVYRWLVLFSSRTPHEHLPGYMLRWWLVQRRNWLPFSIRVHHILRADNDRHLHDHDWSFRSIILSGWYKEERLSSDGIRRLHYRGPGTSHTFAKGDYHKIVRVSPGGVITLVIMTKKRRSDWGFLVNGEHINHSEYLGVTHERRQPKIIG